MYSSSESDDIIALILSSSEKKDAIAALLAAGVAFEALFLKSSQYRYLT